MGADGHEAHLPGACPPSFFVGGDERSGGGAQGHWLTISCLPDNRGDLARVRSHRDQNLSEGVCARPVPRGARLEALVFPKVVESHPIGALARRWETVKRRFKTHGDKHPLPPSGAVHVSFRALATTWKLGIGLWLPAAGRRGLCAPAQLPTASRLT